MASERTAEEVEREYLAKLGPKLGALFWHLRNEATWLNWTWHEFTTLFGATRSRIELLNGAAPAFFRVAQDSLWEGTLLHVSRLTDPPQSVGKGNLTLRRLPDYVAPEIRPRVQTLLDAVLEKAEFARDWRKRHIAHRDLALVMDRQAIPLAQASRLRVNEVIRAINDLLNCIDGHYRHAETYFESGFVTGNAESLLYVLRDGLEVEERRQQRLEAGKPLPEDVAPRPAV